MKTIRSLEGLRGVAAVGVVLFHTEVFNRFGVIRNGYLAVDLFFVLSGFVMCHVYGATLADLGALRLFVVRRFGRLYPVYLVTTLLFYGLMNLPYFLASFSMRSNDGVRFFGATQGEALAQLTLTQSLHTLREGVGNVVSWSISCEFYIYLVFAAACILFRGRARIAAFAALALTGFAVAVWSSVAAHDCLRVGQCFNVTADFGAFRCAAGFFAGALIAEHRDALAMLRGRFAQIAVFGVAVAFLNYADASHAIAFAAPLIFAALVASLTADLGYVAALLQSRIAQFLGRVSFSLYLGHGALGNYFVAARNLQHGVMAQIAVAVAFLVFSLALAHLLQRFVEVPFRSWFRVISEPRATVRDCRV